MSINIFNRKQLPALLLLLAGVFGTASAWSDTYKVTITNMTAGQSFTPRLVVTHSEGNLFVAGQAAFDEVATIAESGNTAPMAELLESAPDIVTEVVIMTGLLAPGATEELTIEGEGGDKLSLLNMLIPTNDAFLALDAVSLPSLGTIVVDAIVYDAGSELNDESCSNIPGPTCGGVGDSPEGESEGYIHVHAGIHGIGDLAASEYDWRNPAARVTITRVQ